MGASCGCMTKKASSKNDYEGGQSSPSKNSNIITNKGGVQIGSNKDGGATLDDKKKGTEKLSREEIAKQRAEQFEKKKKEEKNRGLTKESAIELQLKEKRMADAEQLAKEKGDNYNMRWGKA